MKKLANNRYISFLVAAAFLVSVMLPYFASYHFPQIFADKPGQLSPDDLSSLDEKIFICTSDGFKWVSLKDLLGEEEQPKPHTQYECALCYFSANHLSDFILAQDDTPTYHPNTHSVSYPISNDVIVYQYAFHSPQPRAPPHLA